MADNKSLLLGHQDSAQIPQQQQENIVYVPEFKFGRLFEGKKERLDQDLLEANDIVCLYFAASHCHPSKAFTPKLIEFYNEVNIEDINIENNKRPLEILLVPFDKNELEFKKYLRQIPWISLPFDPERIESYRNHFNVKGIPQLVVLDGEGNVLVQNACQDVLKNGEDAYQDWIKAKNERQQQRYSEKVQALIGQR
ncbi:hypothetical protein ABPG74_009334 [Tetrahymena malaccensis]